MHIELLTRRRSGDATFGRVQTLSIEVRFSRRPARFPVFCGFSRRLSPAIIFLSPMQLSALSSSIIAGTVSDLRGLPAYPRPRRRCSAEFAEPRVWRETAMPPVLGKETTSGAGASRVPLSPFPVQNSFEAVLGVLRLRSPATRTTCLRMTDAIACQELTANS